MQDEFLEDFSFDEEKFRDAVHFIIDEVVNRYGSDALGNTKLHKCLYYADMLHFLDKMEPLTGAEYQRQKFGPTARHLSKALKDLEREGRVKTDSVNYYGFSKKHYVSLRVPTTNRLSDEERKLILHVADFVCESTATEISEFSHDEVWSSVPMGARIPYFACLAMFPAEFTPEDLEDAEIEAEEIAPRIQESVRAGRVY